MGKRAFISEAQGNNDQIWRGTGEQRVQDQIFEGNRQHKKTNFRFWGNRGTSKFISGEQGNRYPPPPPPLLEGPHYRPATERFSSWARVLPACDNFYSTEDFQMMIAKVNTQSRQTLYCSDTQIYGTKARAQNRFNRRNETS